MPEPRPVLIDCDPGVDDAIALLLAAGSPALDVRAVTTVAGNLPLPQVTRNARHVCALAGLEVPIAAGCERPLVRDLVTAPVEYHGDAGLGGRHVEGPLAPLSERHAVDLMVETVLAAPGEVTLVPIGPLTNVAVALRREPRLAGAVREVVLMGGSTGRGNQTPAAEFNIFVDPEAAAAVLQAPWKVTMVGLNLTHQAQATPEVRAAVGALNGSAARLAADLLDYCAAGYPRRGLTGPPIHDACAVARVADPSLVRCVPASIEVETQGRLTSGMTVTDLEPPQPPAHLAATTLEVAPFWDLLLAALANLR
ncbi:MAG: nucleoside hydrolase [Candidatus Dormibacteraeota bacterium]|nr:nucleoside hydrolase [Candidatus Dormibacteraeota bacterium]MBO0746438.1 nucleoside hydrolase [Candidatus Dormibacteraeota bacterium]